MRNVRFFAAGKTQGGYALCVQAQRVFDACIKQGQSEGIVLNITDPVPANPTYPLTFISARSTTSAGTVAAFQIDRLPDRAGCARVQATVDIPVEVIYTDANGTEGKANAVVTVNEDVILFVPQPSVMPYEVQAVVSAVSPEGTFNAENNTFTVDMCITVILKIIINVRNTPRKCAQASSSCLSIRRGIPIAAAGTTATITASKGLIRS